MGQRPGESWPALVCHRLGVWASHHTEGSRIHQAGSIETVMAAPVRDYADAYSGGDETTGCAGGIGRSQLAIDRWERITGRAREAAHAAALRAQAARQRRAYAEQREVAIREQRGHGEEWVETATERAAAATQACSVARTHAVEALERASEAHAASALAHEPAAALAESLADVASQARHLRAVAGAREAAELDRTAADEARRRDR